VTGATGYVGGRLVPLLLKQGYRVRAAVRNLAKAQARSWARHPYLEIVSMDVIRIESLKEACRGCHAAYYLVHSMNPGQNDFSEADRLAARNMTEAAAECGLDRIIYLGGLGEEGSDLSKHLASRHEVARILQSGPVPVTVLRAGAILGSGSASFEILRYLVDRLPVMATPRWVSTLSQPIAVRNVLQYLVGCLEKEETKGETFDIGGPEILSYRELMRIYAEEAGLRKRWVLSVPVLTPRLSSYWIHLVTPVHASIARPLAEGLRNPVVCRENRIRDILPQKMLTCRQAIRLATDRLQHHSVETSWIDAGMLKHPEWVQEGDAAYAGGKIMESAYRIRCADAPREVWKPVQEIGGERGWYFAQFLWVLRGFLDRLLGGVGLRRGRRHPTNLIPGDHLDFWRVLAVEPRRRLLLVAEMKVPGEATLEFRLIPNPKGGTEIRQICRFRPRGLLGILYWYALFPFHVFIFKGMLRSMARTFNLKNMEGPQSFDPSCKEEWTEKEMVKKPHDSLKEKAVF
jgi:uncharacterized protein YbjT (DUF2867 family)